MKQIHVYTPVYPSNSNTSLQTIIRIRTLYILVVSIANIKRTSRTPGVHTSNSSNNIVKVSDQGRQENTK